MYSVGSWLFLTHVLFMACQQNVSHTKDKNDVTTKTEKNRFTPNPYEETLNITTEHKQESPIKRLIDFLMIIGAMFIFSSGIIYYIIKVCCCHVDEQNKPINTDFAFIEDGNL